MTDNRRIMTWSMRTTTDGYRRDIAKFNKKIYSIGLHEFGVNADGTIYDYRSGQEYFNAGVHTGVRMPIENEQDMIDYPHIKWFLQPIVFGWTKVQTVLDSQTAQTTFIGELQQLLDDVYSGSRNSGTPLNFTGVEMDVEAVVPDDAPDGYDQKYIDFLKRVKDEVCNPRGLELRVNAYAMWGDHTPYYYRFHNYQMLAEATDGLGNPLLDELQIMTYDFSWGGSSAGASTPIWWFRQVGDWVLQCFDPTVNPNAVFTKENIYFGSAGYGHRWGIHEPALMGKTVTFRQLVDWQNGYYRHYHYDDVNDVYVYHDQEYLTQCGFNDPQSNNQIMYPHVYDFGSALHAKVEIIDGRTSAVKKVYNRKDYVTTYSRFQQPDLTGVHQIKTNPDIVDGAVQDQGLADRTIDGVVYTFDKYATRTPQDTGEVDAEGFPIMESEANIVYNLSVPAGTHKLIACVAFPWFTKRTLQADFNGTPLTIGGSSLGEEYPYINKGFHLLDLGDQSFTGTDTITISGSGSEHGTSIYGFIVADDFNQNLAGGAVTVDANVQPMVKKDKSLAPIPTTLALPTEMLRQDARPALLFEDRFGSYFNEAGGETSASIPSGDYYLSTTGWTATRDEYGRTTAMFNGVGGLELTYPFTSNVQVESEFRLKSGSSVALKFGDGLILKMDFASRAVVLSENGTILQQASLPDNITEGSSTKLRAKLHNGKVYCFIGNTYTNPFGAGTWISTTATQGGICGVEVDGDVNVYLLGVGSLDKWEPMEKFEVIVDGQVQSFGEIPRTGYSYDQWGFINYSGIDEKTTRDTETGGVSLDYQIFVPYINGFQGSKTYKVRFVDAGLWFANIWTGDAEGCSITYAGDAESFNELMNIATNEYGVKGIGLWVMGYEDPKTFTLVPDVI